jgi:hypothetical protein
MAQVQGTDLRAKRQQRVRRYVAWQRLNERVEQVRANRQGLGR